VNIRKYQDLISPKSLAASPALAVSAAADWLEENQSDGAEYVRHFAAALLEAGRIIDKEKSEHGGRPVLLLGTNGFVAGTSKSRPEKRVQMETGAVHPDFYHPRVVEIMENFCKFPALLGPVTYMFRKGFVDLD